MSLLLPQQKKCLGPLKGCRGARHPKTRSWAEGQLVAGSGGAGCRSHTCPGLSGGAREALVDVQLCTQGLQEQALLLTLLLQERHHVLQPAEE